LLPLFRNIFGRISNRQTGKSPTATLSAQIRGGSMLYLRIMILASLLLVPNQYRFMLKAPADKGPYRLFLYLKTKEGKTATANACFYVHD